MDLIRRRVLNRLIKRPIALVVALLIAAIPIAGCSKASPTGRLGSALPPLALTETECESNFIPEALPLGRATTREENKELLAAALNLEVIAQGFLEASKPGETNPLHVPSYLEVRTCDFSNHQENSSFFNDWWAHDLNFVSTPDCPITLTQTSAPPVAPSALDSILLKHELGGVLHFESNSVFFQNLTTIESLTWSGSIEKRTLESNPSFRTQETRSTIEFTDDTPAGFGDIQYGRVDQLCQISVRPFPVGRTAGTYMIPVSGEELRVTVERTFTGYSKNGISTFYIQGRELPLVELRSIIEELVSEGRLKSAYSISAR